MASLFGERHQLERGLPVEGLADDVGVPGMAGRLPDQVQQHPAHGDPALGREPGLVREREGVVEARHRAGERLRLGGHLLPVRQLRLDGLVADQGETLVPVRRVPPHGRLLALGAGDPALLGLGDVFDQPGQGELARARPAHGLLVRQPEHGPPDPAALFLQEGQECSALVAVLLRGNVSDHDRRLSSGSGAFPRHPRSYGPFRTGSVLKGPRRRSFSAHQNGKALRPCWTEIHLVVVNESSMVSPFRRPMPDCFSPPKGTIGSSWTVPSLTWNMPVSICLAKATPRSMFAVWTAPLRPYGVSLTRRTASSSLSKVPRRATGPKSSCLRRGEFAGRSVRTEGSTRLSVLVPWISAVAPSAIACSTAPEMTSACEELMTGPMTVSGSRGSPAFSVRTLATNFSVNSSATVRSTRTRLAAMQT